MGKRGEGWVVLQGFVMALVALMPLAGQARLPDWLAWPGFALMAAGAILSAAGWMHLGTNLTAFPRPIDNGQLVTAGAYGIVRHPIYSGLIIASFGWACWTIGVLTLGAAALLLLFFDLKSRQEERWLTEQYAGYPEYRKHVKKLLPFIY